MSKLSGNGFAFPRTQHEAGTAFTVLKWAAPRTRDQASTLGGRRITPSLTGLSRCGWHSTSSAYSRATALRSSAVYGAEPATPSAPALLLWPSAWPPAAPEPAPPAAPPPPLPEAYAGSAPGAGGRGGGSCTRICACRDAIKLRVLCSAAAHPLGPVSSSSSILRAVPTQPRAGWEQARKGTCHAGRGNARGPAQVAGRQAAPTRQAQYPRRCRRHRPSPQAQARPRTRGRKPGLAACPLPPGGPAGRPRARRACGNQARWRTESVAPTERRGWGSTGSQEQHHRYRGRSEPPGSLPRDGW